MKSAETVQPKAKSNSLPSKSFSANPLQLLKTDKSADALQLSRQPGNESATSNPFSLLAGSQQKYHQLQAIQRVTDNGGSGASEHIKFGNLFQSVTTHKAGDFRGQIPVVIEVNEMTVASAKAKIDAHAGGSSKNKIPVAFIIGLNKKETGARNEASNLAADALAIARHLESKNVEGGCFSFTWTKSGDGGGYTFPFLEARSILTLHGGAAAIHARMAELTGAEPVMRSMDGDVSDDALLGGGMNGYAEDTLVDSLKEISEGETDVISGAYLWNQNDVEGCLRTLGLTATPEIVGHLGTMITLINKYELQVRSQLVSDYSALSVYWPEPNTYMKLSARKEGAKAMKEDTSVKTDKSQQKESTHYLKAGGIKTGAIKPDLAIVKPMKTYLNPFLTLLHAYFKKNKEKPTADAMKAAVLTVHQSHLNPAAIVDNYNWTGKKMKFGIIELAQVVVNKYLDTCSADIASMMGDAVDSWKTNNP